MINSIKKKDHEIYKNHIEAEVKSWIKIFKKFATANPSLRKKLEQKIIVYDIGAGCGGAIIALQKLNYLKQAFWIDPNFEAFKGHLAYCGYKKSFFTKNNITVINKDGLDSSIDYSQAELVIKTFNGWIQWVDVIPNLKKGTNCISSYLPDNSCNGLLTAKAYYNSGGNQYMLLKK